MSDGLFDIAWADNMGGDDDVDDGDGGVDDDEEDDLPQELSRQGDTSCPSLGNWTWRQPCLSWVLAVKIVKGRIMVVRILVDFAQILH